MNLAKLPQLPQDKANHLLYGCAASVVGGLVAMQTGHDPRTGAMLAAVAAGAAKEAWDKASKGGTPSLADFLATAAGCVPLVVGYCLAVGVQ